MTELLVKKFERGVGSKSILCCPKRKGIGLVYTIKKVIMPNFSSFRWEMTEIYRKDRPTDIVMYRGNYSQLKNIFLLQTQPISSRESPCQISVQSVKKWPLLCQLYLYEVLLGKSLAAHCEKCRSAWLLCSPIYEQQHIFTHRCFLFV